MDQDSKQETQNKRLREMFRLFQRTRKQREKSKERAAEEERKSPQHRHSNTPTPGKRQVPHSPGGAHRASKERRKSPYLPKKLVSVEETTTVDDEDVTDESPSAKKRRQIRKKYGIQAKDEEFFQRASKDDVEEFENVAVALRPAATKMRKAKLRWKTPQSPVKHEKAEKETFPQDSSAPAESAAGTSWDELTAAEKAELEQNLNSTQSLEEEKPLNPKYAEKYAKLKEKPQEKIEQLLKEIYSLLLRVDELEQAQSKFLSQIRKLRNRVALKEKRIIDLSRRLGPSTSASVSASAASVSSSAADEKSVVEEDKPSPKLEAVALRGLDIMKRNQLLEQTVNEKEAKVLANFFESEESKPDKLVVMLIDKAFNYGLEVLLMRPDLFEDYVDNELRLFLLDAPKAKRVLLDCILLHPEYVPTSWGGNILAKRQQERQRKAEDLQKQPEKQPEKSKSAEEESPLLRTTRTVFGFLFDPNKWTGAAKEEQKSSAEKSSRSPTSSEKRRVIKQKEADVELKTDQKSEAERKSDKQEPKSEYDRKVDRVEVRSEYQKRPDRAEPKSEYERKSAEKSVEKDVDEVKRSHPEKRWKYRSSPQKTPQDTAWVQDRAERRLRNRAKSRLKRHKKKN